MAMSANHDQVLSSPGSSREDGEQLWHTIHLPKSPRWPGYYWKITLVDRQWKFFNSMTKSWTWSNFIPSWKRCDREKLSDSELLLDFSHLEARWKAPSSPPLSPPPSPSPPSPPSPLSPPPPPNLPSKILMNLCPGLWRKPGNIQHIPQVRIRIPNSRPRANVWDHDRYRKYLELRENYYQLHGLQSHSDVSSSYYSENYARFAELSDFDQISLNQVMSCLHGFKLKLSDLVQSFWIHQRCLSSWLSWVVPLPLGPLHLQLRLWVQKWTGASACID